MDLETARQRFPHGTQVLFIAGDRAGSTGSVVGVDPGVVAATGAAVLTVDVGDEFDEVVAPDEVEVLEG